MKVTYRQPQESDASVLGKICYEAFTTLNQKHGFPPDFPAADACSGMMSWMIGHPKIYGVVAEIDGQPIGSNFLDERGTIAGIGPITVDPARQDKSVGRELMNRVIQRTADKNAAGVRLVQAAFHNRSMSLYTKLGFVIREPLVVMQGAAMKRKLPGYDVRPMTERDFPACAALCETIHGHSRAQELPDALSGPVQGAMVVERAGRITGYTTNIAFFGHTVGETNDDIKALIAAAEAFGGPGFLLPTRNHDLFRWCLDNGLRIVEPMTLMSIGLYNDPAGAFLPSIWF